MPPPRPDTNALPSSPGVYRFIGADGRVLYVGKAKSLRSRVPAYFRNDLAARTAAMVDTAAELTWVVCGSESEALVLEREWIRQWQPPFNIALRDGGGYSGVAVTDGAVPRLIRWRGRRPDNAAVFGPYPAVNIRDLIDTLTSVFGVRTCTDVAYRAAHARNRPCLLADTGHCDAPCVGRVSGDEHQRVADELVRYLRRPDPAVRENLENAMHRFAAEENFEAAARRRDQIQALETIGRVQRVVGPGGWHRQALGVVRSEGMVGVSAVVVTDGIVSQVTLLDSVDDPDRSDTDVHHLAYDELCARGALDPDQPTITTGTGNGAVVRRPRGPRERDLAGFAVQQAETARVGATSRPWAAPEERTRGLAALAHHLGIDRPLRRIECIDISHTRGTHAVGSLVVLVDGVAAHGEFRHVKLGDTGGDDYAAIAEVVRRRFSGNRMGLAAQPDLLLIDGGPGQIASADRVLEELGIDVARFGIAKRLEELWPAGADTPILLDDGSVELRIVQHVRDQAHRTALRAHRRNRENAATRTRLEDIPGVGPAKRRALLARFGTVDAIAAAGVSELAATATIGDTLAQRIWDHLHPETT